MPKNTVSKYFHTARTSKPDEERPLSKSEIKVLERTAHRNRAWNSVQQTYAKAGT